MTDHLAFPSLEAQDLSISRLQVMHGTQKGTPQQQIPQQKHHCGLGVRTPLAANA